MELHNFPIHPQRKQCCLVHCSRQQGLNHASIDIICTVSEGRREEEREGEKGKGIPGAKTFMTFSKKKSESM